MGPVLKDELRGGLHVSAKKVRHLRAGSCPGVS